MKSKPGRYRFAGDAREGTGRESYRGTRRTALGASLVASTGNRLREPCHICGARRYERCYTMRPTVDEAGERDGYYPFYLAQPHSDRPINIAEPLDTDEPSEDS